MPPTNGDNGWRKASVRATETSEWLTNKCLIIYPAFYFNYNLHKKTILLSSTQKNSDSSSELSSADWVLSAEELASKFTPRTKAIVINTPNDPLGKVRRLPLPLSIPLKVIPNKIKHLLHSNEPRCHQQVYKMEELKMIADLCTRHNVLCISDETYEWLTYDDARHFKIGEPTWGLMH